jgi:glutamine amidotransferase
VTVAVVDYGIGNLRSAHKALVHVGVDAVLATEADQVAAASGVVLPGVGAFGRCAAALRSSGLADAVQAATSDGRPFLGICVGFQLLFECSDEAPDARGLGVLPGRVRALPDSVKRPQIQWNRLLPWPADTSGADAAGTLAVGGDAAGADAAGAQAWADCPLLGGLPADPWVYFVHSFAPDLGEATVAVCDYGGPVTAVAGAGRVWGTQFHPEKSGAIGLTILRNFARLCGEGQVEGEGHGEGHGEGEG